MKNKWVEYDGYVMRSKAERRMAAILDGLGISWLYEHMPFDFSGYLPDFYLPVLDVFIEVKGKEPTSEEKDKCRRLSKETCRPVIMVYGEPLVFRQNDGHQYQIEANWLPMIFILGIGYELNINHVVRHIYKRYGNTAGVVAAAAFNRTGEKLDDIKPIFMQWEDDFCRRAGIKPTNIYHHNGIVTQKRLSGGLKGKPWQSVIKTYLDESELIRGAQS